MCAWKFKLWQDFHSVTPESYLQNGFIHVVGVEEVEVIFLNDFRWEPKLIAWADLLQALVGDFVHLPAPKTFCQRDLELSAHIAFFATADAPIVLIRGGAIDRSNFFSFGSPSQAMTTVYVR